MARTQSTVEVRDEYVKAMPGPLGEAYYELYNHVANLFSKWHVYGSLYDERETIDLLNKVAGGFFHNFQLWLRENIFLQLCRLTDPPQSQKTVGKENLTLQALPAMLPPSAEASFRDSLQAAVNDTISKTAFAKIWRDKMLAHTALPVAAGGQPHVIPNVSQADWKSAMDAVGKTMNLVESHYLGGHIAWDQSIDDASGTLGLLFYLRRGFEAQQKEESEWLSKRGKTSSDAAVEA